MKKIIVKVIRKVRRMFYKFQCRYLTNKIKKIKYEYGLNTKKRDLPKIIVSLTTFPKRFGEIDLCLKSILNQSFKPDKIIIWLGSDTKEEEAKKYFDKYRKYGIDYIIDTKNNYYSHKKYIYSFEKYKDCIIITFDDDLIYPKNVIKQLVKKHIKYPNCIVARRVHEITWTDCNINKYLDWNWECFSIRKPTHKLCPTTGAGTLFPPSVFPSSVTDYNIIKKYALTADDIWLKMMAVKNKVKVVWAGNFLQMPPEISSDTGVTLSKINVIESNNNDKYIKNIFKQYKLTRKDFE